MTMPVSAQEEFDSRLAPYASRHDNSFGRRHQENSASDRTEFQRDSTRVMHSSAFRRLQYKTQVFSNHAGDLFRTRLTHSLEVAQVSRASARALKLNDDLVETLALAHDLGHAPFGHLGQDALNDSMRDAGGYEHNWQGLRIVDSLEEAYIGFKGLNLLYESREGILKHCSARNARLLVEQANENGDPLLAQLAARFLPEAERLAGAFISPSLEAQLTDLCDAIAYTHADMEDAVTMGTLTINQLLDEVPLFKEAYDSINSQSGFTSAGGTSRNIAPSLYAKVASGWMMKAALNDLIENSKQAISDSKVETIGDVRAQGQIIRFGQEFFDKHHMPFKRFLRAAVYTHPDVEQWRTQQREIMLKLFADLQANPSWVPSDDRGSKLTSRMLCDYLSAMTDRSVMLEFDRVSSLVEDDMARKALPRRPAAKK